MPGATRTYGPTGNPPVPGLIPLNTSAAGALGPLPTTFVLATGTETVVPNPQATSIPLMVQIPSGSPLEGQKFEVYASGVLNCGASSTVNIKLYSGTSPTVGNDTLLGASGALTAFSGKANWYMNAPLIFDSVSGKLTGTIKFVANNVIVAEVAISNVITGVKNSNNPVASFLLSVTFGTANAANSITLDEFAVNF